MEENVGNSIDPIRDIPYPSPISGHDVCGIGPMTNQNAVSGCVQSRDGSSNDRNHLRQLGVQLYTGPKNPDMGPLEVRKASFVNSGWDPNFPISSDRLAEAGFYYFGKIQCDQGHSDAVKCFHCDLGLAQWEQGDDPWVEHAKKADNCNFLKMNKSKTFLDECKRMELGADNENPESNHCEDGVDVCRIVDQWMSDELVEEFKSLNLFSNELIKTALINRYYSHKRLFDSFADMYDSVSALAERSPSSRQSDQSNRQTNNQLLDVIEIKPTLPKPQPQPQQSTSGQSTSAQSSSSDTNSSSNASETQPKTIEEIQPDMENPLLCKICYMNEIEVVFLACGHQMACTQCAQRLTDCPVCRQPIQGYVRTFFS